MEQEKLAWDDPRVGQKKVHFPAPVHLERPRQCRGLESPSPIGDVALQGCESISTDEVVAPSNQETNE
jgi:hypothetical protein